MERFTCGVGMENRTLSRETLERLDIRTPERLHLDGDTLLRAIRAETEEGWTYLPLCNTLCSESLGAFPTLTMEGAKVRQAPYQRPEELPDKLTEVPRLGTMLAVMDRLRGEGARIAYQIEGPFTLLTTLLPMGRMFAALRKSAGLAMLERAEDWVCQYAALAVAHGASLLSFADPVATVDILGEKFFTTVYRDCCVRVLKRLRREHPAVPIHLCGKLTQSLLDTGCCRAERWEAPGPCETYGQALTAWCEGGGDMAGQFCMNLLRARRPWLTLIEFEEEEDHGR